MGIEDERVCSATGLWLVRAAGQTVVRLAKPSYGPMNPPPRDGGAARAGWSRFDVPSCRTMYAASTAYGAYAESLAPLRPAPLGRLTDYFDEDDPDESRGVLDVVAEEWGHRHSFLPGFIPRGWRDERREYELTLPSEGWFVDVEHSASVAAMSVAFPDLDRQLDVGHLRGPDRQLTTSIAAWLHTRVLDDGRFLHGIRYGSKHGSDWTDWAVWLRVVDDGGDPQADVLREPTQAGPGRAIGDCNDNVALNDVCDLFGLRCY